ncbi:MAG: hypothetical protein ACERK6_08475 [Candidatus Aminicenantaceae bacterium]
MSNKLYNKYKAGMMKHAKQRNIFRIGTLVVLSMVLLASFSCTNTTEPEVLADIVAQNLCGAAVDVFLDGVYQFSVEHATDETIYDLPFGSYTLEAKKKGEEMLVFSGPIEVTESLRYIWVILGPSTILIGNAYGETIDIYMNGSYAGQIPTDESREIPNIAFGTHYLGATRVRDNVVVDELTLEIEDVGNYAWLIENK